jgi:hypothetical protein
MWRHRAAVVVALACVPLFWESGEYVVMRINKDSVVELASAGNSGGC